MCSEESTISCINNGIKSRKKKFKIGFRFVDSASACNFYQEKIEPIPFFLKYSTEQGTTEWNQKPLIKSGSIIVPDSSNSDETITVNCRFECGNANMLLNIALTDFGSTTDGYLGAVFK